MKRNVMLNSQRVYDLLDLRATYSFISYEFISKLNVLRDRLSRELTISTPIGETIYIDNVYDKCNLQIMDHELKVNLMPLWIYEFNIILGMNWLSKHQASMDSFTKTMTFKTLEGNKVEFKGERKILLNCIILIMTARKMLRNGCDAY